MAIDKAVDSAVLEAGLTAIADAIREKGGTSETLAFPDAMAEAIEAIAAGGLNGIEGTFTPSEDITTYTVSLDGFNHDSLILAAFTTNYSDGAANYPQPGFQCLIAFPHHTYLRASGCLCKVERKYSNRTATTFAGDSNIFAPNTVNSSRTIKLNVGAIDDKATFTAGVTYKWIVLY